MVYKNVVAACIGHQLEVLIGEDHCSELAFEIRHKVPWWKNVLSGIIPEENLVCEGGETSTDT